MYDVYEPDAILGQEFIGQEFVELTPEEEAYAESVGALEPEYAETVGVRRRRRGRIRRLRPGMSRLFRGLKTRGRMQEALRTHIASKPPIKPALPGAPPVADKQQVLPFTNHTFTVAAQGPVQLVAQPQCQFRGERIITIESPNAAAVTDGVIAVLTDIKIGNRSEFVGAGTVPFATFQQTSFGVRLLMDGGGPGIQCILFVSLLGTLATAGAEIFVAASMIGDSIQ